MGLGERFVKQFLVHAEFFPFDVSLFPFHVSCVYYLDGVFIFLLQKEDVSVSQKMAFIRSFCLYTICGFLDCGQTKSDELG